MAWRKQDRDIFPAPLREFREREWPPVPGECLLVYSCRGQGYEFPCAPRDGETCGQACYAMLARDYPDRPDVLAAARSADAFTRYHEARLSWLGEDHPGWLDEFLENNRHQEIREAPFRASRATEGDHPRTRG